MSVPYLPVYVLDLIAAVDEFEDQHAKTDDCLIDALHAVPAEVRAHALGYARGKKAFESTKEGETP